VQQHCQKPAGSALLSIYLTVLRFGVPFTTKLLLSAGNLTPSLNGSLCITSSLPHGEEDRCLHGTLAVAAFPEMLTKSVITRATLATCAGCVQRGIAQTTPFSGRGRRHVTEDDPTYPWSLDICSTQRSPVHRM